MQETRILIIDDVAEIHANIRSIFALPPPHRLDELTKEIFGETKAAHPYKDRLESLVIDSAYQGEEGFEMIKAARAEGRPYSIVLVDMRMPPGWDGLQTIKKIREVEADTEIIICSAYSDYSWHEIAAELGANDKYLFLSKPFELTEMKQMVMNLSEKFSLQIKNREAMEVLRKANAAAESSAEAKQEFLSIIGHELRTPLNVILLTLEELLEEQKDDEALEVIRNSHRSTLRLARTVEDILSYTQLDRTDFRFQKDRFALSEMKNEIEERWSLEGRSRSFRMEIAEDLPEFLLGDREKLLQLINQLLSNAFKFDSKGPILAQLSLGSKPNPKSLVLPIKIEVRDQGIGMTKEQLGRSMELFYQANSIVSGSGLGLSYVKKLVDALGGTISLESDPGLGTLVTLHLPFFKA